MSAKRHHYVPRVILRRFSSDPDAANPPLVRLDVSSGTPEKTNVNNEAVIGQYYRLTDGANLKPNHAEETLGKIESEAAEPIRKLVNGEPLTVAERVQMAFFLHVQRQRTPLARKWSASMYGSMARIITETNLQNSDLVREQFSKFDPTKSNEEIERWRLEILEDLRSGRLVLEADQDHEVAGIFFVADRVVPVIAERMAWVSLRAEAGSTFVCSDHPLHIYDRNAPPGHGVGWVSSPTTEVTMPIDQRVCLLLKRGPPTEEVDTADAGTVQEINLRTYASAQWSIYGPYQQVVQDVRTLAKRSRARLAELQPRPPRLVIFERVEGEARPQLTTVYRPPSGRPERRPKR